MEISQLKQFQVIARTQNLSLAAKELYISQPALSIMIKKLEKELGTPLFKRTKNSLKLNLAGQIISNYANRIIKEEENMKEDILRLIHKTNSINLAFCDPGPRWYLIPKLSLMDPELSINSNTFDNFDKALEQLKGQIYDFIITSQKVDDALIISKPLLQDQLCLSVDRSHPLASSIEIYIKDLPNQIQQIGIYNVGGDLFNKVTKPYFKNYAPQINLELYDDYFIFVQKLNKKDFVATSTKLVKEYRNDGENRIIIPIVDKSQTITYYINYLKEHKSKYDIFLNYLKTILPNNNSNLDLDKKRI